MRAYIDPTNYPFTVQAIKEVLERRATSYKACDLDDQNAICAAYYRDFASTDFINDECNELIADLIEAINPVHKAKLLKISLKESVEAHAMRVINYLFDELSQKSSFDNDNDPYCDPVRSDRIALTREINRSY